MMRSMWKGTVTFGLVAIPIRLYAATQDQKLSFHQVHIPDGSRVQHRRFCAAEDKEVPYDEIGKGYETADGQMVVLTDEDLAGLPLPSAHTIEVLAFVPIESVDPIHFDRTYFLEPEKSAVKPFVMLRDAMGKSGRVAVTKVAIRQRESLALLRVYKDDIVVETMLWPEQVRTPDFDFLGADPPQVGAKEMKMAAQLIDAMAEPVFDPDAYRDEYQQALKELVRNKIEGGDTTTPPSAAGTSDDEVSSLLEALASSVEASRGATPEKSRPKKAPSKKAPPKKPAAKKPARAAKRKGS
ncbi:Ku protein [Rhodococcus sp. Q]|uniref:non-homologous end joining protein Ku n=1 Tax=Rhodococcus sp. Q TaxID=2502252 RepID=UPI0020160A5D|nr:Ku protein [Rhodococcus sp. Q]